MAIPNYKTLEQAEVNTIRVLACEAISNANSGHSGIVLGAAPIMYAIYNNMKFDPHNGHWFNRDRFILSAGHGSALLYATLKCFGVPEIDLKTFRKLGSPLTGHPELDEEICVDCSTGPLGQGIAMAVGVALAEKKLANEFNFDDNEIINHHTFCLVGDGDLMEGVSYEACNLAGLWKLDKLIVLYDYNNVTLDGTREAADAEDVTARFKSMGWNVISVKNGNDEYTISSKIRKAVASQQGMPTLIIVHTELGYGAKNAGTNKAHGQVLSMPEIKALREKWDLDSDHFEIDEDVREHFTKISNKKIGKSKKWHKQLKQYEESHPIKYKDLCEFITARGDYKPYRGFSIEKSQKKYTCKAQGKVTSGRDAGHDMLNQIAKQNPRLWGGSADVASTTKAFVTAKGEITMFSAKSKSTLSGANIAYGVREFAMAAISNGLALHGFNAYCSTFLAFSDYSKPAIRLSAMMNLPVTYIFSHDGIGNAPDGSTHQANEHITALRITPNMAVFRPSDDIETAAVYEYVFENQKPSSIILSRGNLPSPSGADCPKCGPDGCFSTDDKGQKLNAILLSSGSDVQLCVKAKTLLGGCGVFVNVISVPCIEMFDASVLDKTLPVIAVELGNGTSWWALFGKNNLRGEVICFDDFGPTGSDSDVMHELGFTPEKIADRVLGFLGKERL